jgi:SpoVK/Ycf46/Vps4 family AAA+-type ATPase
VPTVRFEDIGGYADVKGELLQAIGLMRGAMALPTRELRRELIPVVPFLRPAGTGKTLFAKAIASSLEATIQLSQVRK